MQTDRKLSRRHFFQAGAGAAGAFVAGGSVAHACLKATSAQPLGPFFPQQGTPVDVIREDDDPQTPLHLANDNDLTFVKGRDGKAQGQVVYVDGTLRDADCQPLPAATIIIWQAAASGRYNHKGDAQNQDFSHPVTGATLRRTHDPHFQYWGRATTDASGNYSFKTIVPGFYPANLARGWYRPPHIHFLVMATGVAQFVTQMYFRGEQIADNDFVQELNEQDFLLQSSSMTKAQRRALVVDFVANNQQQDGLVGKFDITLP